MVRPIAAAPSLRAAGAPRGAARRAWTATRAGGALFVGVALLVGSVACGGTIPEPGLGRGSAASATGAPGGTARSAPSGAATPAACPSGQGTPIVGVPTTELPCLNGSGGRVRVSSVHGRPQVINIWASWCAPCQRETPLLEAAHEAAGRRVLFLGVDVRDRRTRALAFLAAHGVTYPQVFDREGSFPTALGLVGVPDTLVVDATGRVVYRRIGELSPAQLRDGLARVGVHLGSLSRGCEATAPTAGPIPQTPGSETSPRRRDPSHAGRRRRTCRR